MALVRTFELDQPERTGTHAPVRCTYFTFTGSDGQPYLQFNTYGSSHRKQPSIPSQSIQLDRDSMKQLAKILVETLGERPAR